jgi:hypothetical protein
MTSPPGDDNVRLSIWLVSFHADPADGIARPAPLERLQRAFGVSAAMAQQFLDNMPLVVKRHASKEEARGYVQTLIRIGAEVRVEPEEPAPVAVAPVVAAPVVVAPPVEAPAPSTRLGRIALAQAVAPVSPSADSMFEPEPPTMDASASDLGDSVLPLGLLGEELPAEGFGVEEDWDALMPDPEAAPLPPVPWPDELEVMLAKGAEAPPRERAPHEHNMLSLDAASLSDPGLLGTEEYNAVMQLNRDLAPSQEEDAPIALLDDLPSQPFGPPLGGAPRARPAQRVSQRQGPLPTEARLPSLDEELGAELAEDALPSLSELAPASGDMGRKDVLRSFDEAEAGAGLPSAPLMGVAPSPMYTPPKRTPAPTPSPPRHVTSPPRHTTAPPRQVTQPAALAVEATVGDGRGFWASLGVSLVAPVRGLGILWMPLIALVQVFAGCFLILPCFITQIIAGLTSTFLYMGLLGTYFGASVRKGLERDATAPELPELSVDVLKHEVIFRGAVLALLALVLFAIPTAVGYDAVRSVQPPDAPPTRTFDPQEPFFDDKGAQVEVKFGESARVLTDRQGNQVMVNPSGNEVELLTPGAQREPVKVSKVKLTLFFVLLFVPLFYWPMALTVAALGGGVADIFNPVTVGKGIVRGGGRYVAVAGLGALIFAAGMTGMVLTTVADAAAGTGGLTAALCGMLTPLFLYAYIHGVQGQLVGRLIADQPDDFSDLLS